MLSGYFASLLQGALLTVGVSLAALVVAILLGLLGAVAKLSGRPILVGLATVYTTLVRGVPELVLMLLIFYGGTIGLNHLLAAMGSKSSVDINPFLAGMLTIGFIYGAYMTETFRGAILSIPLLVTVVGLQFGAVLTGAVITETIFAWPGVGRLLVQSITFRDYPLVQGCILLIAAAYVTVNLMTDLVYGFLDPRIRFE